VVHLLIESAKYNIRIELTCLSVTLFAVAALGKKRAIQATQLMRTLERFEFHLVIVILFYISILSF